MGTSYYDWATGEIITSARLNAPWTAAGALKIATGGNIGDANSNELILFPATVAAAVNEITVSNAATTGAPSIVSTGGDANIDVTLSGKGTGNINLGQATCAGVTLVATQPICDEHDNELIKFSHTNSAVNEITVTNKATGSNPDIAATGGDTNVGLTITPKGNGDVGVDGNTIYNSDNQLVAADFPTPGTSLFGWNLDATAEDAVAANYGAGGGGTTFGTSKTLVVRGAVLQTTTDVIGSTGKFCKFQAASYLDYTADTALDVAAVDFSVGGWFKIPDWSPAARTALMSNTSDGAAHGWTIELSTAGLLSGNLWGAVDTSVATDVNYFAVNTWHHIVFTRDAGTDIRLYVDGQLVGTGSDTTIGTTQQKFQISGLNGANNRMEANSHADECFLITGTSLTLDQVKKIYARSAKKFVVADANGNIAIPDLFVSSGSYTPTLTNTTNISASTGYVMRWVRIGNNVVCNFHADIDPTNAAPTASVLTFTLPIACTATPSGRGSANSGSDTAQGGVISMASATTATLSFPAMDTDNMGWGGIFIYTIN